MWYIGAISVFYRCSIQAYRELYQACITAPGALTRPYWWEVFTADKPVPGSKSQWRDEIRARQEAREARSEEGSTTASKL